MYNVTFRCVRATTVLMGKQRVITQPVCAFVALGIQHAMRLRHIFIYGLPHSTTIFPHDLINGTISKKKKKLLNTKCVLIFSTILFLKHFSF